MPYPTIQFTNKNRCAYATSTSSLLCVFALIFLFVGYIGLSHAESVSNTKKQQSAQTKLPTNSQDGQQWVKGRLLITPRAGLTEKEMKKILGPQGVRPWRHIKELNVHICDVDEKVDEAKLMRKLKKDRRFKNIELDRVVKPDLTVIDPEYSRSWALPKIGADKAWDSTNGDGVTIAILDTGVNSDHPDLVANMIPGWNSYDNNADSSDVHGHGTKVAGSAAAAANNAAGSVGVAWGANIMPIRVADENGYGYYSTIAAGIRWAADNGAKVANVSFSGVAASSTIKAAADYMRSKGGVVVVSAGNTGKLHEYAASNSVLVASATGSGDVRPSWSSYGPYVDVAAPGVSIYTTTRSGGYGYVSGTSFSSPITAATVALMMSVNNELSPTDLHEIIKSTAVDLGAEGFDRYYGSGRVDAAAAVTEARARIAVDDKAPVVAITSPEAGRVVSGIVPIDVQSSDNVGVVRVEFYVNDQLVTSDELSPFAFVWDSTQWNNGSYTLTTKAYDAAGNVATSAMVAVTVENATAIVDTTAPTVSIAAFQTDAVTGSFPLSVNATDNVGVTEVELYVDGQKIATDDSAPFTFIWNSTNWADGEHVLTAKAHDAAGNTGVSSNVKVIVQNSVTASDTTPPTIVITAPKTDVVMGTVSVTTDATDNVDVARAELFVDGQKVMSDEQAPFTFLWNTAQVTDGKHTLSIKAYDAAGNVGTSPAVSVIVSNTAPADPSINGIIVDNQASNTALTGTWKTSSGVSPFNGNSIYSDSNGTFRWKPSLGATGKYKVYAWWTYHKNRSSNVPYRVNHANGVTKVTVDQHNQPLASKWVLLGTFEFDANGTEYIEVSSENGQASADAVLFMPDEVQTVIPSEIIIDNLDASTSRTGTWYVSSGVSPYKTGSLYNNAASTFTWGIPSAAENERYEVFVWWTYHNNRSSNVPYRIHHRDGVDTVIVNQHDQSQGGKWISLGEYTLKGDGTDKVVVSSENGQACADAVRLVRMNQP